MRLILLLVAIYSLIFYQHYKLTRSKTLLSGSKVISASQATYRVPVSQQQQIRSTPAIFTNNHSPEYKSSQWKPLAVGFMLATDRNR